MGPGGAPFLIAAREVVLTLPPQTLPSLLADALPPAYRRRIRAFPDPSGALVFYGAVERSALPPDCAPHQQLAWADPGSLFLSVSREGDGRAPRGQATVIASVFTPARPWFDAPEPVYQDRKAAARRGIEAGLQRLLGIAPSDWLHGELATPGAGPAGPVGPSASWAASASTPAASAPSAWPAAAPCLASGSAVTASIRGRAPPA